MTEVLLIEDDAPIRKIVRGVLERRGFAITESATLAEAQDATRRRAFDVVILDVGLPDGSGLDVLAELRRTRSTAHVIVLSNATTELDRIRALDLGADDYVVKPFFARELAARVLAVRRRQAADQQTHLRVGPLDIDVVARRVEMGGKTLALTAKEFDLLAYLASRPGHTFSRDDLLRAVWDAAPDWQRPSTVTEHVRRLRAKIEVDPQEPRLVSTVRGFGYRFDVPPEQQAQGAGPVDLSSLKDRSTTLRQLVTGVVGEVSDAVIVCDPQFHVRSWNRSAERIYGWSEAEVLGRDILDVLVWEAQDDELASAWRHLEATDRWHGEARQITHDGSMVHVWASTTLVRDDDGTPVSIVSVNRPVVVAASPGGRTPTVEDVAELRRGIIDGEFEVHYQPVVALNDRSIITVEALVRWNHPLYGLVGPPTFMDTAEKSGVVVEIGAFVLRSACEQTATWRHAGWDVNVAVNLSAAELAHPDLVERITTTADACGLDLHGLWLEITETELVENVDAASAMLHRLAALGVGISIDDFGTGWASLTYLRRFPIHALKIDRTFVAGVNLNASDAAIVRSILSLAAELDLFVVAEGVETLAQERALRALGCSIGQGFLYGRPTPASEVPVDRMRRIEGIPVPSLR